MQEQPEGRRALSARGPAARRNFVPPPILMLIAAAVMWVLHRWFPVAYWIAPPWTRLGVIPCAVGIAIDLLAVLRFRHARTTLNPLNPGKASRLVTEGVFSISRNPMYLGLLLLLVGWALWLGTASVWLVPPLFVAVLTFAQILPEERVLGELFGAEYSAYTRAVARWIGRRSAP